MDRIIWHWSAGTNKAGLLDLRHYHFVIEGDGTVVRGAHAPEANREIKSPADGSTYAAHTRGANTGSIGVALAAMRGAKDRPFSPGPSPITPAQVTALASLTAELCRRYDIKVTRHTVLSHAEVDRTLGVPQAGKWDITWLPGMPEPGDAVAVGDILRASVLQQLAPAPALPTAPSGGFAALVRFIMNLLSRLFGKMKP